MSDSSEVQPLHSAEFDAGWQPMPCGCDWMTWRAGLCNHCHCGEPVAYGYDGDPTHHRGMCEHCDLVRCDAYPGACMTRVTTPGLGAP